MRLIDSPADVEPAALSLEDNGGVYFVPAFAGLGAPWWNDQVKAAVFGMTLATTREHFLRAALESIAYQVNDLVQAMVNQAGISLKELRVDGGPTKNNFLMQFQADILQKPIDRPRMVETTAFGAAFLAGLSAGVWTDLEDLDRLRQADTVFTPQMAPEAAEKLCRRWEKAVARARDWAEE